MHGNDLLLATRTLRFWRLQKMASKGRKEKLVEPATAEQEGPGKLGRE